MTHWPRSFISIDTETTGLGFDYDRIIQLAVAVFLDGQKVWDFNWYLNTDRPSSKEAYMIHGIDDGFRWRVGLRPDQVFPQLYGMVKRMREKKLPIITYNAPFDWTLIRKEWEYLGLEFKTDNLYIFDPLVVDRHFQRNIPPFTAPWMRQIKMAARYGVSLPTHDALADATCSGYIAIGQSMRYTKLRTFTAKQLHDAQKLWYDEWAAMFKAHAEKHQYVVTIPQWAFGD